MKVKAENLKDSQKLVRIEVDAEKVNAVLNDVYNDIKKTARIDGYRVGKAPRDLLEAQYEKTANEEILNRLMWEEYRKAVIEEGLDPVGYPIIEKVDFDKTKPLVFTVKVDVRPEFNLRQYKQIKIKEEPCEITDEDVNKALSNVQESMAQYKNVEGKPVASGDYLICSYECFLNGKLIDKNDKLWLYINDQLQPKELFTALLGADKDVTKEFEAVLPSDYQNKELAGKRVTYKITPKQIKQKILSEINDDLAKETGRFKDLEDLKRHLRENLLEAKRLKIQRDMEEQIFDVLLKSHSFDVPLSLVERQVLRLVEDTKLRLLYQGYKKQDIDKEDDNLKKALWEDAKRNVRLYFILERIAKEEKIEVSDKELDEKIEDIAKETKEEPSEVKSKLQEKNLLENLREQMLHDKIVEFLLKEAKRV